MVTDLLILAGFMAICVALWAGLILHIRRDDRAHRARCLARIDCTIANLERDYQERRRGLDSMGVPPPHPRQGMEQGPPVDYDG